MTTSRKRFTAPQRLLHWLMAICILTMLFIGVGMVSTVTPKYLTLVQIHKPLGIAILVLVLIRLTLRLIYKAPALPPTARANQAGRKTVPICPLRADDQHAAHRLGNVVSSVLPGGAVRQSASATHPALESHSAYVVVACTSLPGLCLLRNHPDACRSHSLHKLIRNDGAFETMAPVLTRDQHKLID